jgi:O-antigen/teichoic acid export membrane protein
MTLREFSAPESDIEPPPGQAAATEPSPASSRPSTRAMLVSASATAVMQGASNAMAFVVAVLLARYLGAKGYGLYALALAWASVLIIPAVLGFERFLVRTMAVYELHQQWELMKGLLERANQLVLLTSVIVAGLGVLVAITLLPADMAGTFCVAMLAVPLTSLTMLRQGAMQALGRIVSAQLPEYLIRPILILAGVLVLEFVGHDILTPTTALAANVVGLAVAFVTGAILLVRALPDQVHRAHATFKTSAWLRGSLPMMLISGVWMANGYITTLMVGTLSGPRAAGVYSVVQRGAEIIVVLLFATNMPLAPAIARLYARDDREGLERTTEQMARAALALSLPLALVLIVFPGVYLGLFGSAFRTGETAMVIVAFGQLINATAGPSGNVLIMTGHERLAAYGVTIGLIVNIGLAFVLVPSLGVTGGGIAYAASLILWNMILVIVARRRVGVNVTAFRVLALTRPT